jgi:hypothetical protein
MPAPLETNFFLELNRIEELFNAPAVNPFSSHEVEIRGESGFDRLEKNTLRQWPRSPGPIHLVLKLPPDQITPDLAHQTRLALQSYCEAKIDENRMMRKRTLEVAWRQFIVALMFQLPIILALVILLNNPFDFLPETLRVVLAVLLGFIGAVAFYDSVWSLVFEWIPFVRDNRVYRTISDTEISVESIKS